MEGPNLSFVNLPLSPAGMLGVTAGVAILISLSSKCLIHRRRDVLRSAASCHLMCSDFLGFEQPSGVGVEVLLHGLVADLKLVLEFQSVLNHYLHIGER